MQSLTWVHLPSLHWYIHVYYYFLAPIVYRSRCRKTYRCCTSKANWEVSQVEVSFITLTLAAQHFSPESVPVSYRLYVMLMSSAAPIIRRVLRSVRKVSHHAIFVYRRKIAEHELAPEKKDVKKIQQLQQTMTTVKDELIKAGVDVNAVAIQDDSRLKNKEMRYYLTFCQSPTYVQQVSKSNKYSCLVLNCSD